MDGSCGQTFEENTPTLLSASPDFDKQGSKAVHSTRMEGMFVELKAHSRQIRHLRDCRLGPPTVTFWAFALKPADSFAASENPIVSPYFPEQLF